MKSIKFDGEEYYTVKEVYTNLCVARTAVINKLNRLEQMGCVLRIKNKRPEIYISQNGYNLLKEERINYLDEEIEKANEQEIKEYYKKLKDAIGKPELWDEYHKHIVLTKLYYHQGELVAREVKCNGECNYIIYKDCDK